jgi:hypothetical protein
MNIIKEIMTVRNKTLLFGNQDVLNADERLYADYNYVTCFNAVHVDVDGDESAEYCWYVPGNYNGRFPAPGDRVIVENLDETAIVTVTSHTYTKTVEQHVEDLHPYCAFIGFKVW